jgi:hypothetical protein
MARAMAAFTEDNKTALEVMKGRLNSDGVLIE